MNIRIVTVGRIKEKFLTMAIDEYSKRLKAFCKLEITEVKDERTPDGASPAENQRILAAEGDRIAKYIRPGSVVVTLDIQGEQLTSPQFSKKLEAYALAGKSDITFIIGGSLGLAPEIKSRAQWSLSFSKMTFPHQLFRVMLLEQIYRAFKISKNEPYHK
ncbi:MAG: 23S rRNA (pseudouridine(1915)-N(3))-methyltransferase RlmH [Eubacterium sp.]|nr:23S rRNA (pseudouridine(1915)-N(3))-methyltransferase RlmH [Eubacterium sp.]